jgi:rubrerythrin
VGKLSSIDEVLEFAIERELEANQFYLTLAKQMNKPLVKKMFEELAAEELEHKAKLEFEIIKEGKVVALKAQAADFHEEDFIIDSPDSLDMDYKDVLVLGIHKEDTSFRLYVELLSIVRDMDVRETLFSLVEEEVRHKQRFEDEYNNLKVKK